MPLLRSWVETANDPACPFPLNNLPYGVFSTAGTTPRCGVAIGDFVLDVAAMEAAGLLRIADDGDDGVVLDVEVGVDVVHAAQAV